MPPLNPHASAYLECRDIMSDLLIELQEQVCLLTLNRIEKHNAFDNHLLNELHQQLELAIENPKVRVLVLKANGKHFSAGADLAWMQSMARYTEEENLADSMILGNLMFLLNQNPKPTIAMIQGSAYGGGAGFAAACDISIAASNARFCFSEVKLGLIPAVISPYVIQAIGERNARMLFMTAEVINASRALALNLIQHCVAEEQLLDFTLNYAQQICNNAPQAVSLCKKLTKQMTHRNIDKDLVSYTASLIAAKRISIEGQKGLKAFLNKETPHWEPSDVS